MRKPLAFLLFSIAVLPLGGCDKVQARAELKKGNAEYANEAYKMALAHFQKGLELDPAATFAWRSVGLSALALYHPGDESAENMEYARTAIAAFENYLKDFPDDQKIRDYLMSTYVNAKMYDQALAYLDTQMAENPDDSSLGGAKVRLLVQAGRFDEAWDLAMKVSGPAAPEALYSVGVAIWDKAFHDPLLDTGTKTVIVDKGLEALKKALDVKPDYYEAMAYYNLLFREKAKVTFDPVKAQEYTALADQWLQKAIAVRKKAEAEAARQASEQTESN
jgi:tetratricopeptide (TPR) repeat protein